MANSLINEESPYLLQHANNPIDWFPWGDEALEKAKKENKPIFLSIGYSSCHWCHVMEKESFENIDIAKKLNENFICIKVDKEERPDIDKHFQEIFIKMNNKPGGWPLTIFLTPNLNPVYSATYIPPYPKYGLNGLNDLIDTITKAYKKDSKLLEKKGQEVLEAIKPKSKIEATKLSDALISIASRQIKQVYDKKWGGFGDAPKFPNAYTLELAINLYKLTKDDELKKIVTHTLDNMLLGGIYDIVDGGFCRYSTDRMWLVPHFEKMTYDNALMINVLIRAHKTFDIKRYKEVAAEITEFMQNRMSQENLFFTASDADSNAEEGGYFVYDYSETKKAFENAGINSDFLYRLGITKKGNFEGKSIVRLENLNIKQSLEFKKAIKILRNIRAAREYPFIDKKIITSWNAMMVSSLFEMAKTEPEFLEAAEKSLKALEEKMVINGKVYHSALIENKAKIEGFLEDYAWLIKAYLQAYSVNLDEIELIKAADLTNAAIKNFYSEGFWRVGGKEFKNFANDYDASYPSSVSIMVQNLLTLRSLAEPVYEKFAFKTLEVNSYNIMRQPISRPTITDAAIRYIKDDIIIKSNSLNLKDLQFDYPYVGLKVTNSNDFQICNNKACFATAKTGQELKEILKTL